MGMRDSAVHPGGKMTGGCFGAIRYGFSVHVFELSRVTVRLVWFLSWFDIHF